MPKKIQNFAKSALVKPITINVGRAGAASLDVIQVTLSFTKIVVCLSFRYGLLSKYICKNINEINVCMCVQEVEYVKEEAKMVYLLECLQKTPPPVRTFTCLTLL